MLIITQFDRPSTHLNSYVSESDCNYSLKSVQLRESLVSDFNLLYSKRTKDIKCNYSYFLGIMTNLSFKYQLPLTETISLLFSLNFRLYDDLEKLFNSLVRYSSRIYTYYIPEIKIENPIVLDKYEIEISYTKNDDTIGTAFLNAPLDYPSNVYSRETKTFLTVDELLSSAVTNQKFLTSFNSKIDTLSRYFNEFFNHYETFYEENKLTRRGFQTNVSSILVNGLSVGDLIIKSINSITITKNSVKTVYNLKP